MGRRPVGAAALTLLTAVALALTAWAGPGGHTWLAVGDSFSSGEGIDGASGRCARSGRAYPIVARELLAKEGVRVGRVVHAACTRVDASGLWLPPPRGQPVLLEEAERLGLAPGRSADLITLTLGGNEVGFADVVRDCAGFELNAEAVLSPGCSTTQAQLRARVDRLKRDGVELPGGAGAVSDLLRRLADERLAPEGHLFVVGYPLLFADPATWSTELTVDGRCAAIGADDARMLNRVTDHLVDVLADETARAADGDERIHFVDVRDRIPEPHRICGSGAPWINGLVLTTGASMLDTRGQGSYHLNGAGHEVVARAVAGAIRGQLRQSGAV